MAGNQRKNGFSKATAITIDDSSDDEVNLINMSDENSFQKTPRFCDEEKLYSQVVSSAAKMKSRVPRSSDDWQQSLARKEKL